MAIFLILGVIVALGIALMLGRARAEDGDDDDDNTPGGPRRIRIPVRDTHRGPR